MYDMLNDEYFKKLYNTIMNRISGKSVFLRNIYSSDIIYKNELFLEKKIKEPGVFSRYLFSKERESLYYKELLDNKNISVHGNILSIREYSCYEVMVIDIITGIKLPCLNCELYLDGDYDNFIRNVVYNIRFNKEIKSTGIFAALSLNNINNYYYDRFKRSGYFDYEEFSFFKKNLDNIKKISNTEVEEYIKGYMNKDMYIKYLEFWFTMIDLHVVFDKFYEIPPFIPSELHSFYKQWKDNKKSISSNKVFCLSDGNQLNETRDKSFSAWELIVEIREMIEEITLEKRSVYLEKLNSLIDKYDKCSLGMNSTVANQFENELCRLLADIKVIGVKENYFDVIEDYFNYWFDLSRKVISLEEVDTDLEELFKYVRYFFDNKKSLELYKYLELQDLISIVLANILILNPSSRDGVIKKMNDNMRKVVWLYLKQILFNCLDKIDKGSKIYFAINAIKLEDDKNMDLLSEKLAIFDSIDSDIVNSAMTKSSSTFKTRKRSK